jgi:hypothetical protein
MISGTLKWIDDDNAIPDRPTSWYDFLLDPLKLEEHVRQITLPINLKVKWAQIWKNSKS